MTQGNRDNTETRGYRFLRRLCGPPLGLFFRYQVTGQEHVPMEGPFLVCANHPSFLDPPLVGLAIPRQVHFLMSKAMYEKPFFNWFGRTAGVLPLETESPRAQGFRATDDVLERGGAIGIFPEGGRSKDGTLMRLKQGVAFMALRHNAPILPLALFGTHRALPVGAWFPRPYKVRAAIQPPILPQGDATSRADRQLLLEQVKQALCLGLGTLSGKPWPGCANPDEQNETRENQSEKS